MGKPPWGGTSSSSIEEAVWMPSVLVMQRDPQVAEHLRTQVELLGHEALVADSIPQAIRMLLRDHVDAALVDLDTGLPSPDAVHAIRIVREVAPAVRCIAVSPEGDILTYRRALKAGALDVLPRTARSAELSEALEKALDAQDGLSGSLHGMSLVDMLQLLNLANRSVLLRFDGGGRSIHMIDGEVVHAVDRELEGRVALRRLLQRKAASVHTQTVDRDCRRTIHESLQMLLLDLMREIDEEHEASKASPKRKALEVEQEVQRWKAAVKAAGQGDLVEAQVGAAESVLIEGTGLRVASRVGEIGAKDTLREYVLDTTPPLTRRAWLMAAVSHYQLPMAMLAGAAIAALLFLAVRGIWGGGVGNDSAVANGARLEAYASIGKPKIASPPMTPEAASHPVIPVPRISRIEEPSARAPAPKPTQTRPPLKKPEKLVVKARWGEPAGEGLDSSSEASRRAPIPPAPVAIPAAQPTIVPTATPAAVPAPPPSPVADTPPSDNIDPWRM